MDWFTVHKSNKLLELNQILQYLQMPGSNEVRPPREKVSGTNTDALQPRYRL